MLRSPLVDPALINPDADSRGASTRIAEGCHLENRVRQLVWGSKRAASASEVAIFGFGSGKREGQRLMAQSLRASDASLNS